MSNSASQKDVTVPTAGLPCKVRPFQQHELPAWAERFDEDELEDALADGFQELTARCADKKRTDDR